MYCDLLTLVLLGDEFSLNLAWMHVQNYKLLSCENHVLWLATYYCITNQQSELNKFGYNKVVPDNRIVIKLELYNLLTTFRTYIYTFFMIF
jgi:hypothetical protein